MDEETDDIPIHVDLGFQGLQNEFVNIKIPDKKPRGKELTEEHKQSNREKSSIALWAAPEEHRVKCEHIISGIKRYNAVTALYKNRIDNLDVDPLAQRGLCTQRLPEGIASG